MTINDVSAVRKCIRACRQILPMNPTCIVDIHSAPVSLVDTLTTNNEEFLLVNDDISNTVIFSCNTNLKMLCKSEIIYVDGTFSYCPSLFSQLFTIHGLVNVYYIPTLRFLFTKK